jgi:hypothetical protein
VKPDSEHWLDRNTVSGCPGWTYGVIVRHEDGSTTFDVVHEDGRVISGLRAGRYAIQRVADMMGDKQPACDTVARAAIRGREQ